jgi:GT2 family glycosyltransferase
MRGVKSPFILLLNSDVYLEEDSLYKTIAYFRVNLNCDVLGARLNYSTGKLQPSAGFLPNPLNIIFWIFGFSLIPAVSLIPPFHPKDKRFFSKAHQVGWIMGAFFALKRKVFEETSGFDERIFMHMEEVEWCKRIKSAGFKVWFVPQVEVVHLHGASTDFDLKPGFLNELKGIKYFLQKHYSFWYFPIKLFLILGLILRVIAFSLLKKTQRARIYLEGLSYV